MGLLLLRSPNSSNQWGTYSCLSKQRFVIFLEYESIDEKMPGKIWKGRRNCILSFSQKHRSQKSGIVSAPRCFAEIRIGSIVVVSKNFEFENTMLVYVKQWEILIWRNETRVWSAGCSAFGEKLGATGRNEELG